MKRKNNTEPVYNSRNNIKILTKPKRRLIPLDVEKKEKKKIRTDYRTDYELF